MRPSSLRKAPRKRSFRPLIRGFFFYSISYAVNISKGETLFPSPHSGILFLWTSKKMMGNSKIQVSVPLFGDSFFMGRDENTKLTGHGVSVPSFGDSFFMDFIETTSAFGNTRFPSPHSGILFLSAWAGNYCESKGGGFRPLIRGFFFYPVVMICRQV